MLEKSRDKCYYIGWIVFALLILLAWRFYMLKLKKDVNMLSGSIVKGLLTIALPIMVMNIIQSLFNIIDMRVLKTFASNENAVGAVGVCGTLISLITGLLVGCSSGANVVIARLIGKRDLESSQKAVGTAVLFAACGGAFLAVVGILGAEVFLGWMNCPDALMSQAALYFRLYFAGVPILMVYNFCASILRSTGDSRRPMLFLTTGGVLKVLCNLLFVGVFDLAVVGVAFATIISWTTACTLGLRAILKNTNEYAKLKLSKIGFHSRELSNILTIGIPTGLQQALYSIANVIISATVNDFGADATTGISIANNFDGILYQIAVAPSLAVMPYVSQNLGANNLKRAKQAVVRGMFITIALAASIGALSAIFSGQLSSILSSNPEAIKYSQQKMVIISSTYFICGINEIMGAALKGFKRPIVPMVSTMVFMCGIRFIWVYLIFPYYENLTFLYLIWPIGWILSIITLLCFYIPTVRGNWQKRFVNY